MHRAQSVAAESVDRPSGPRQQGGEDHAKHQSPGARVHLLLLVVSHQPWHASLDHLYTVIFHSPDSRN